MASKKLRIAILASDFIRIPPRPEDLPAGASGAPEFVMYQIAEAMVKKGHDVTLFASGNSQTSAKLVSLQPTSTGVNPKIGRQYHIDFEYALISKCYQMACEGKFDIIHSLFDIRSAIFAGFVKTPTVVTLHSPLTGWREDLLKLGAKAQYYVSISNAQRANMPEMNFIKTIYHGLDISKMPFSETHDGYLMFIGRIRPEKGVHEAIAMAKRIGKKLIIAGSSIPGDRYWEAQIKPFIDQKQIVYVGHQEQTKNFELLKKAEAFLFSVQYDEPFGLVLIEAQACGVPVVGYAHGAIPEVVKNGKTGFVVDSQDEVINALKKIGQIRRADCRKWVEENFSLKKMMDEYEKVYYEILDKQ